MRSYGNQCPQVSSVSKDHPVFTANSDLSSTPFHPCTPPSAAGVHVALRIGVVEFRSIFRWYVYLRRLYTPIIVAVQHVLGAVMGCV